MQKLDDGTGIVVPSFLKRFGLENGPKLPPSWRLRLYGKGVVGGGKSSFAASIPHSLHIDLEDSACFVVNPKCSRFVPTTMKEIVDVVDALVAHPASENSDIRHVSFDPVESLVQLAIPFLTDKHNLRVPTDKQIEDIREYGTKGAGWNRINTFVVSLWERLYAAGYGWLVTGHEKIETLITPNNETRRQPVPMVNDGVKSRLIQSAQFSGRFYVETAYQKNVKVTAGGRTVIGTPIETTKYFLDLTPSDTDDIISRTVKVRLAPHMTLKVDVTGENGWGALDEEYVAAGQKALNAK